MANTHRPALICAVALLGCGEQPGTTEANLDEWRLEARFTNPLCPARPALGLPAGVYCSGDEAAASRDAAGIHRQFLEWIDAAGRLKQEQPDRDVKITVAYMSFSDASYEKALCDAAARGVEIFGVFDKRNGGPIPSRLATNPACGAGRIRMASLGGQTDSLETWRIFHMKMMLIEDGGPTTRLVVGSPNLYEGGASHWFESWVFATLPSDARFYLTARGDRWVLAPQHSLLCMAPRGDAPTPVAQGDCGSEPPAWTLEPAP